MMKNKKGFTLVELIAVIGIISLLIALSSVALINIRSNVLNNDYENLKSYLETRAAKYASDTNIKTVSVEELIKEGYVKPDDNTDVYNPVTNESMNCVIITSKDDGKGNYTSTLGEDLGKENGKCVTYQNTGDLEICLYDSSKNTCEAFDDDNWFNHDIELSVRYKNGNEIEDDALIEWDSNNGYHNDGKIINITTDAVITSNYHVKVTVDKKVGEAKKAVKVDKKAPVVRNVKVDNGWSKEKTVVVDATDTGSGVKGYALILSRNECSNNANDYQASNTFKINKNGTYKACVIDKASNYINASSQTANSIIEVNNIDTSIPKVPVITASDGIASDNWHREKTFSLTFTGSDNVEVGMSPVKYYYGFSKNNANVVGSKIDNIDESNYHQKTIYVRACNEAGSCSEFSEYKVKMDSTPPSYKSGGTLGNGTLSLPTYEDNSRGSGSVKVYTCVSTQNVTSTDDSCFKLAGTTFTSSCGTTYKLYSYAIDEAGNKSAIHEHSNDGSTYYRSCGGGGSSRPSSCDYTCQMKNNSEAWHDAYKAGNTAEMKRLENENAALAAKNPDCNNCTRDNNGYWNTTTSSGGTKHLYEPSGGTKTTNNKNSSTSNKKGGSSSTSGNSTSSKGSGSKGGVCLAENTLITMADGTKKPIQEIDYDDLLLVWSYELGKLVYEYPIWIEKEGTADSYQLTTFSDGSTLKTVGAHAIFNKDLNMYVSVTDKDNFKVGTNVLKLSDDNKYISVKVKDIKIVEENVKYYYVASTRYYNVFANDFLTSDGLTILSNLYGFENMMWPSNYEDYVSKNENLFKKEELNLPDYLYYGLRAGEAKKLEKDNLLSLEQFKQYASSNLINAEMVKSPLTDDYGNRMWMVTTSNGYLNCKSNNNCLYKEHSMYRLPLAIKNGNKKFVGWYNMADGKMYKENELVTVNHGMHFEAVWEGN